MLGEAILRRCARTTFQFHYLIISNRFQNVLHNLNAWITCQVLTKGASHFSYSASLPQETDMLNDTCVLSNL